MAFNNYLEDENDKPYFTTNSLAYYYDKMEGFAKAVEGSAKALNLTKEEVEKRLTLYIEQNKNELDQRLADWDGKLKTFDSSIETLLTEWVDDGTLTPLIDSTLIDQKIAPVTAQLEDKAGKEEVEAANLRVDNLIIPISAENSNIQVTDALVSTVKSKSFTTLANRLEAIESETFYPITNLVSNGNFENTANWVQGLAGNNVVLSSLNNTLTSMGKGLTNLVRVQQNTMKTISSGKKVAVRLKVKVLNSISTNIRVLIRDGVSGTILLQKEIPSPVINSLYEINEIITISASASAGLHIMIDHLYATAADSLDQKMEIEYVSIVDLTSTFGALKEPSVVEFNTIMAGFPNSWFDGKANLFTPIRIKSLVENEKVLLSNTARLTTLEDEIDSVKGLDIDETENINSSILQINKSSDGLTTYKSLDNYKYPLTKVWGHEYLYSWYKRIADNQNLLMTWAGDSTTANTSISDVNYHRNNLALKIMKLGGYDETKVTSLNSGHGGNHTGDWLAQWLSDDMVENPNLYVLGYGINDGGTNYFTGTTIQQRAEGFRNRLREGLGRIRTSNIFPSGASYNKSADVLSIIICMPVTTNDPDKKRTKEEWHNYIRPIIQEACRDFQCAFVDLAMHQYDRTYAASWSTNADNVHPNYVSTADYMSVFKDVLIPYTLQK